MTDEAPRFNTVEEFYEYAKKNWPPDSQFCVRHWAPFAMRERSGGLVMSVMYITDFVVQDTELAKRAGGDPNVALKLAAPYCCHYGEEVYERMLAELDAPDEWLAPCLMKYGNANRRCRGVLHDKCREAREAASGS